MTGNEAIGTAWLSDFASTFRAMCAEVGLSPEQVDDNGGMLVLPLEGSAPIPLGVSPRNGGIVFRTRLPLEFADPGKIPRPLKDMMLVGNGMEDGQTGSWGARRLGGEENPETPLIVVCSRWERAGSLGPQEFMETIKGIRSSYKLITDIVSGL